MYEFKYEITNNEKRLKGLTINGRRVLDEKYLHISEELIGRATPILFLVANDLTFSLYNYKYERFLVKDSNDLQLILKNSDKDLTEKELENIKNEFKDRDAKIIAKTRDLRGNKTAFISNLLSNLEAIQDGHDLDEEEYLNEEMSRIEKEASDFIKIVNYYEPDPNFSKAKIEGVFFPFEEKQIYVSKNKLIVKDAFYYSNGALVGVENDTKKNKDNKTRDL